MQSKSQLIPDRGKFDNLFVRDAGAGCRQLTTVFHRVKVWHAIISHLSGAVCLINEQSRITRAGVTSIS